MTPEQMERRRVAVGASEVGLLFGLPSFGKRTVSDLWFEKKYGTAPSKGNPSTAMGNRLEPIVLEAAEERLGQPIVDRQLWVHRGCNAATLDGRIEGGPLVEAKTSGILYPTRDEWGDDGTDEVPEAYLLQVQAQLLVTGAELAYLAALIGGRGFAMFKIPPHAGLKYAISVKSEAFIRSLASDTPPPEPPQLDTLKRLHRQPQKVLPGSPELDDLYEQLEAAKAANKATEESRDLLQRQVLAMLGDAEAAECRGGTLTYFEQSRKESVVAASTFRVLRFKKGG